MEYEEMTRSQKKSFNSYKRFKDLLGDNFQSTFEDWYTKKHNEQKFICTECGEIFLGNAYHYRDGMTRCHKCCNKQRGKSLRDSEAYKNGIKERDKKRLDKSLEAVKEMWKDELIIYDNIEKYNKWKHKVHYKCKRCGHEGTQALEFLIRGLLDGSGCSNQCHRDKSKSKYEIEIEEFLKSLNLVENKDYIWHARDIVKSINGNPAELDFYFPGHKLAIEFNGDLWHSYNHQIKAGLRDREARYYHYNKTRQCEDQGIHLIHIWQHEWLQNKDRIKSIIKGELGLTDNLVYARKCEFKEIPQNEYRDFITRLSILRYRSASLRYGLYYNNKLIMAMGIGYCQSGKGSVVKDKLEIVRSVTELDTIVVGGTSKLLKHIIPILNEKYPNIHELVYFVDYDKHLGKSAEATGAIFDGYSGPSGQNYCMKNLTLINKNGVKRNLYYGHIYSRIPAHHKEVKEAIERDDILALYTSGTKKFHYNI